MTAQPQVVYRSAPGIAWVKDAELTLVVCQEQGRWWSLRGIEAAVWDLLTLDYSFPAIVGVVTLLADCAAEQAGDLVLGLLAGWAEQGLVCAEEADEGG